MFTVHTPLAEVLTVVAQQAIAVFSESQARPSNNLVTLQGTGPWASDPHRMSMSETRERNLFHRGAVPVTCECGIVNDGSATDVDAMVRVGKTRRNEVCAQRRFFVCSQPVILAA